MFTVAQLVMGIALVTLFAAFDVHVACVLAVALGACACVCGHKPTSADRAPPSPPRRRSGREAHITDKKITDKKMVPNPRHKTASDAPTDAPTDAAADAAADAPKSQCVTRKKEETRQNDERSVQGMADRHEDESMKRGQLPAFTSEHHKKLIEACKRDAPLKQEVFLTRSA